MNTATNQTFIGQAIRDGGKIGYIAEVKENQNKTFVMIGGPKPMSEIKQSITIVYPTTPPTMAVDVDEYFLERWL